MAKRRRHWGRIILVYVCLFFVLLYSGLIITAALLNNTILSSRGAFDLFIDTTPPMIEMKGGDSMMLAVGDVLEDPGIEVYDDSSLPRVEVESDINITKEGEYRIKYTATDESDNITSVERTVKITNPVGRIYLTFDDGPSEYTATLLDILNKYGVKATFFVTGYGDDALIKREYDEGHAVGLHTMSHVYSYVYANQDNYWADLNAVQDRVRKITGHDASLIRFPGGSSNLISKSYDGGSHIMSSLTNEVLKRNYVYFDWNIDSGDADTVNTSEGVYSNVVEALGQNGQYIVLQHDVKSYSVEAVERIIQYGIEHNYVFSKLSTNSFTARHPVNN